MSKYFPLHLHSHFSLLDGISKPEQIAARIEKLGLDGCAISEHGSVSSAVQMVKAMKKVKKKCILGCELYLSNQSCEIKDKTNRKLFHQVVLAKNLDGWKNLIRIVSSSNSSNRFYYKPRIDFKFLEEYGTKNLISFSGHLGSHLANVALKEGKEAAVKAAYYLQDLFGKGNFWIEIQRIDIDNNDEARIVSEILREVSAITGIPCVATADSHYCEMEDAEDQRVSLCVNLNTTFSRVRAAMDSESEEVGLAGFFRSNKFHIPSYDEMKLVHTDAEMVSTLDIASEIEEYNILGKPVLPPFKCPDGLSEAEYLRQLCRIGWASKIKDRVPQDQHAKYADRIKMELSVLQGANLSGYFLILDDIVKFTKGNGWLVGPGRGSAAGCFTSYLLGITSINPIQHNLLFERFYNAGRNTADHIAFPDIDIDIPVGRRGEIIQYIKDKYGADRVAQMVTYQTWQGKSAIKSVLRVHGNMSQDEMNAVTKHIPDKGAIADDLQAMKEEDGDSSIIKWCLINDAHKFREWCHIDEKGNLQGPLARRFEQAIRLEGTKTNQSKHASGVVIGPVPLAEMCPMVMDKSSDDPIAGMEMGDLEALGIIKLDILGLNLLDKTAGTTEILAIGDIYD